VIQLAMVTHIPMQAWEEAGEQAIVTALDLLEARTERQQGPGPQMSG
jgi:hypothetical protein